MKKSVKRQSAAIRYSHQPHIPSLRTNFRSSPIALPQSHLVTMALAFRKPFGFSNGLSMPCSPRGIAISINGLLDVKVESSFFFNLISQDVRGPECLFPHNAIGPVGSP